MVETYYLNGETLPTMPVPHDCIIDSITVENGFMVFNFEDGIGYHDSIKYNRPDAKSLVIKIHLADEDFSVFEWHTPVKPFANNGYFKCVDNSALKKMTGIEKRLEYLSHYVGYRTMIIELCSMSIVRLELTTDFVEFYWD